MTATATSASKKRRKVVGEAASDAAAAVAAEEQPAAVVTQPPLVLVDAANYEEQLAAKVARVKAQFREYYDGDLDVFRSRPRHYRNRAEFRVWHQREPDPKDMYYIMFHTLPKGAKQNASQGEEGRRARNRRLRKEGPTTPLPKVRVDAFDVGTELLNAIKDKVLEVVRKSSVLSDKLFQANFHTTESGQAMVSLLYHKRLDRSIEEDGWNEAAESLRTSLASLDGLESGHVPSIIGRSRNFKTVLGEDFVVETVCVNGRELKYKQMEGAFSQPNGAMSKHMLEWAHEHSKQDGCSTSDLLELYCGNGNFAIALAENFRRCVGTEISKAAVKAAQYNINTNGVKNVKIAQCSSEDFSRAYRKGTSVTLKGVVGGGGAQPAPAAQGGKEEFTLSDFGTVLVDPPRAGLDDDTVALVKRFRTIVYISCNPDTLEANVGKISQTHDVRRFALFDQFPYTHHVECGVILTAKAEAVGGEGGEGKKEGEGGNVESE